MVRTHFYFFSNWNVNFQVIKWQLQSNGGLSPSMTALWNFLGHWERDFFQNLSGAQLSLIRIIQKMSAGPKINKILKRAALNWSVAEKLTLRS